MECKPYLWLSILPASNAQNMNTIVNDSTNDGTRKSRNIRAAPISVVNLAAINLMSNDVRGMKE